MSNITFAYPNLFYLLFLLVPMVVWYFLKHKNLSASLQISETNRFKQMPKSLKTRLRHLPFILRSLIIVVLITILARPQSTDTWENVFTEGIDIVIALDISGSMLAEDLKPNRVEAAKNVAIEFISGRRNDRIGLVIFSGESFTQCPITSDHAVLINLFKDVNTGMIKDGTAIGMGLATAVNRLKDSNAKSKVIILLTDGVNNMGAIAPETAADLALAFGIKIYTIGVGSTGLAPFPVQTPFGIRYQQIEADIDEKLLKEIAGITGGKYFRATDNQKFREIYAEIDELETTRVDVQEFSKNQEEYLSFALLAGLLLFIEFLLRNTIFKNIP